MNARVFNGCLLAGWVMVTAAATMESLALGLFVGGALLLAIVASVVGLAGIYKAD